MQSVPTDGFTNKTNNSLSFRKTSLGCGTEPPRVAVRGGGGGTPTTMRMLAITYALTASPTPSRKNHIVLISAQAFVGPPVINIGGSGKTPGIVYIGKGKYKATKVTI